MQATHDTGKKLTDKDVIKIISLLERTGGKVYITSKGSFLRNLKPTEYVLIQMILLMHLSLLNFDYDSQTMSAEAGVLGTPYIRYNDFVDKISYLDDLEHNYNLGIGIKTSDKATLFEKIEMFMNNDNIRLDWKRKKEIKVK